MSEDTAKNTAETAETQAAEDVKVESFAAIIIMSQDTEKLKAMLDGVEGCMYADAAFTDRQPGYYYDRVMFAVNTDAETLQDCLDGICFDSMVFTDGEFVKLYNSYVDEYGIAGVELYVCQSVAEERRALKYIGDNYAYTDHKSAMRMPDMEAFAEALERRWDELQKAEAAEGGSDE